MKVSVLVPIYNVEKYLSKCLESLCSQTLQDMEMICINDGSTDASREIVEQYRKKDSRIKVIDQDNSGYGFSMNRGLEKAEGEYIAIVESDDFIEPDMMERLYEQAEKYSAELVKSNCFYYTNQGGKEENRFVNLFADLPAGQILFPMENPEAFLKLPSIWSGIYSRDFLMSNQIRFNETPGASYQDVSFSFQVFACAKRVVFVSEAYYHYRTDNANSSVKAPNKVFCICDELKKIDHFIEERNQDHDFLKWVASRLGYRVLMENYRVLASAFQYTLFLRIVDYLRGYQEQGYLYGDIWGEEDVREVERILDNPDLFFKQTAKAFEDERVNHSISLNQKIYGEAALSRLRESERVVIYGAGKIGRELMTYLLSAGYPKEKMFFAVTILEGNENFIEEIPVKEISEYQGWTDTALVAVAVKGQLQFEILELLEKSGFKKVILVDQFVRAFIKEGMYA